MFVLCPYVVEAVVTNISDTIRFNELMNFICRRWSSIVKDDMSRIYKFLGYNNCMLDNEDDLISMLNFAKLLKLDHIDIVVVVMEMDSDTSDDENIKNRDCGPSLHIAKMAGMELDFLAKKQKVLMGSQW